MIKHRRVAVVGSALLGGLVALLVLAAAAVAQVSPGMRVDQGRGATSSTSPWYVFVTNNATSSGGGGGGGVVTQGTSPWVVSSTNPLGVAIVGTPSVTGTVTLYGTPAVNAFQGTLPWSVSSSFPLGVSVVSGTLWPQSQTGTITNTVAVTSTPIPVVQSTSPWIVSSTPINVATLPAVTQGTSPWVVSSTAPLGVSVGNLVTVTGTVAISNAGSGGTASAFNAAFPITGTAIGALSATSGLMVPLRIASDGSLFTTSTGGGGGGGGSVTQGTSPWIVSSTPINVATLPSVTGTVSILGSVTSMQGTSPWIVSSTAALGVAVVGTPSVTGTVFVLGTATVSSTAPLGVSVVNPLWPTVQTSTITGTVTVTSTGALLVGGTVTSTVTNGLVDANNSSVATLAGAGVFTGIATDVTGYATVMLYVFSNVSSAVGGVSMQFSSDGANWDETAPTTFTAGGTAFVVSASARGKFYRVVYTNGGSAQASFRLQTVLKVEAQSGDILELNDTPVLSSHGQIVRSVAMGKTAGNTFVNAEAATSSDGLVNPANVVERGALNWLWSGTTWDRMRGSAASGTQVYSTAAVPVVVTGTVAISNAGSGGTASSFNAAFPGVGTAIGALSATSGLMVPLRIASDGSLFTTSTGSGGGGGGGSVTQGTVPWVVSGSSTPSDNFVSVSSVPAMAFLMGWNDTSSQWDRVKAEGVVADGDNAPTAGVLSVESYPMMFNGTSNDRQRGTITNGLQVDVTRLQAVGVTPASTPSTCLGVGTTSTVMLAANAARRHADWISLDTNTARVRWSFGATSASSTSMPLSIGQSYLLDGAGGAIYTGIVSANSESGVQTVCAAEW